METEDLREFYITPLYLETLSLRSRQWDHRLIQEQIRLFRENHPDYPELVQILEEELHRRRLNLLHSNLRKAEEGELGRYLAKYGSEPDFREMIQVELEIRRGVRQLHDPTEGGPSSS